MGRFLYSKDCLALTAQHTQHSLIRQGGRQAGGHKLGSGISRGEGDVVIIHKMGVSPGRRHPETLPDTHLPAEGKACAHLPAEGKACAHLPVPRQYGDMGVMQPGGILSEPGHNRPSCPSTNLSQATTDPPAPLPTCPALPCCLCRLAGHEWAAHVLEAALQPSRPGQGQGSWSLGLPCWNSGDYLATSTGSPSPRSSGSTMLRDSRGSLQRRGMLLGECGRGVGKGVTHRG